MFLHRIQVPDFRALKDIDITFEPEFSPSIFPLSSLNGGGKSTLLQLIFILLSCSGDPEKHIFIQNMLEGFKFNADEKIKTLAILKIIHDKHIIFLNFECYQYKFIDAHIKDHFRISLPEFLNLRANINDREIFQDTQLICSFQDRKGNKFILLCIIEQNFSQRIDIILNELSEKVFLAAPLTQFCHFLRISGNFHNQVFFNQKKTESNYYSRIINVKKKLLNFFTYDILDLDYIIDFFKYARDQDFKKAIETGEYGNTYKSVLNELNSILVNKKINIKSDLSQVNFKIDRDGESQELYPEDLSHGELKRLSIYMWLRFKNIENAIVLMDEIENAFHPDWQYQIISDLVEWGESNQYILATHSYELCQALTPDHVKELEPKLLAEKQIEN